MHSVALPEWLQLAASAAIFVIAGVLARLGYKKSVSEVVEPTASGVVLSATIADGRALRDLVHETVEATAAQKEHTAVARTLTDSLRLSLDSQAATRASNDRLTQEMARLATALENRRLR